MSDLFAVYLEPWLGSSHLWVFVVEFLVLVFLSWGLGKVAQLFFKSLFYKLRQSTNIGYTEQIFSQNLAVRVGKIVPSLLFQFGTHLLLVINKTLIAGLFNLAMAITVWTSVRAVFVLLDEIINIQDIKAAAGLKSVKTYIQLIKLIIAVIAAIVVIALLIDRSPLLLLSGLGAVSAVTMLIFKDTILSFTASVQLAANDMLRIGDWIEMPPMRANGEVVDITLHSVKVKNFDNSIVCIPTWKMVVDSFINYRNLNIVGALRLTRTVLLATTSIRFITATDFARLQQIELIQEFLSQQQYSFYDDIDEPYKISIEKKYITNLEIYTRYVELYLQRHPLINQQMLIKVSQTEQSLDLIPLQLYCFTATTDSTINEAIGDAIVTHLIVMASFFMLQPFQRPTTATSKQPVVR